MIVENGCGPHQHFNDDPEKNEAILLVFKAKRLFLFMHLLFQKPSFEMGRPTKPPPGQKVLQTTGWTFEEGAERMSLSKDKGPGHGPASARLYVSTGRWTVAASQGFPANSTKRRAGTSSKPIDMPWERFRRRPP